MIFGCVSSINDVLSPQGVMLNSDGCMELLSSMVKHWLERFRSYVIPLFTTSSDPVFGNLTQPDYYLWDIVKKYTNRSFHKKTPSYKYTVKTTCSGYRLRIETVMDDSLSGFFDRFCSFSFINLVLAEKFNFEAFRYNIISSAPHRDCDKW